MVLHVDRGLYVSGTVLDPDGEPAEDIEVDVEGDGLCFYGETDHSGRFAVGPLCDGTWTVVAGEATSYAPSVPVQATSKSAGLVLQLRPAGQIRVRVIDDATTRACDANVEVASENEARVTCDPENDEFVGGGLAEGSYTVYAVTQDHRVASAAGIALAAGATVGPIVVHLRPAATVRAKYTGKRTSMRCTLGVGPISIETVELAPGEEVEIADVPEDAYLELRDASNVVERRELHLAPGERREVVFTQP
jgi:hypothetical protein